MNEYLPTSLSFIWYISFSITYTEKKKKKELDVHSLVETRLENSRKYSFISWSWKTFTFLVKLVLYNENERYRNFIFSSRSRFWTKAEHPTSCKRKGGKKSDYWILVYLGCVSYNSPLDGSLTTLWFCVSSSIVLPCFNCTKWGPLPQKTLLKQMKKHFHLWSACLQVQGVLPKQWPSVSCTKEWLIMCKCTMVDVTTTTTKNPTNPQSTLGKKIIN